MLYSWDEKAYKHKVVEPTILSGEVEELVLDEEVIDIFVRSTYKADKPAGTNTTEECNLGSNKLG